MVIECRNKTPKTNEKAVYSNSTSSESLLLLAVFFKKEIDASQRTTWYSLLPSFIVAVAPPEVSEEENSLSSPGPLSPPTNNKRIDSYFTPKEVIRSDSKTSVSRNLFGTKSFSDTRSSQGVEVLQTPPQSNETIFPPPNETPSTLDLTGQPTMLDRTKDVHSLLMSKDTRIKELEHVLFLFVNYLRNCRA